MKHDNYVCKTCPRCGAPHAQTALKCRCGYEFPYQRKSMFGKWVMIFLAAMMIPFSGPYISITGLLMVVAIVVLSYEINRENERRGR